MCSQLVGVRPEGSSSTYVRVLVQLQSVCCLPKRVKECACSLRIFGKDWITLKTTGRRGLVFEVSCCAYLVLVGQPVKQGACIGSAPEGTAAYTPGASTCVSIRARVDEEV